MLLIGVLIMLLTPVWIAVLIPVPSLTNQVGPKTINGHSCGHNHRDWKLALFCWLNPGTGPWGSMSELRVVSKNSSLKSRRVRE